MNKLEFFLSLFKINEWHVVYPFNGHKILIHITHESGLWFYVDTSAVNVRNNSGDVVMTGILFFMMCSIPASILQWRLLK